MNGTKLVIPRSFACHTNQQSTKIAKEYESETNGDDGSLLESLNARFDIYYRLRSRQPRSNGAIDINSIQVASTEVIERCHLHPLYRGAEMRLTFSTRILSASY